MSRTTNIRLDEKLVAKLLQAGWVRWSKSKQRYNITPKGRQGLQTYCGEKLSRLEAEGKYDPSV